METMQFIFLQTLWLEGLHMVLLATIVFTPLPIAKYLALF